MDLFAAGIREVKDLKKGKNDMEKRKEIPIWEKYALTVDEATLYFNIGENKIRDLIREPDCEFVLYVGRKALIKRTVFEEFLSKTDVV